MPVEFVRRAATVDSPALARTMTVMSGHKPRRWFQFSLRTLLIVVTLTAGIAFVWMKLIEPHRLQREAIAAIKKLGGTYKTEVAAGWVRYLDWNAQDVVVV